MNNDIDTVRTFAFWLFAVAMYLLPVVIATSRRHRNAGAIFVLNIFLGWSCLGWIGAMVWAHTDNVNKQKGRR